MSNKNKNKIDTKFLKEIIKEDSFNALVDTQLILLKGKKNKSTKK